MEKYTRLQNTLNISHSPENDPKEKQDYIYSNLIYDKKIDDLINSYETHEKINEKYEIDF